MDRRTLLVSGCALSFAATTRALRAAQTAVGNTPVLGGPCEGCEWVFEDMPARPDVIARIAPASERGNYRFDSIRPRAYPGREIPEHVHMHVVEPGVGTYYIDDLRFEDDPLIHAGNRRTSERGGNGLVMPVRGDGGWRARRDIVLGRNVPQYPARR